MILKAKDKNVPEISTEIWEVAPQIHSLLVDHVAERIKVTGPKAFCD